MAKSLLPEPIRDAFVSIIIERLWIRSQENGSTLSPSCGFQLSEYSIRSVEPTTLNIWALTQILKTSFLEIIPTYQEAIDVSTAALAMSPRTELEALRLKQNRYISDDSANLGVEHKDQIRRAIDELRTAWLLYRPQIERPQLKVLLSSIKVSETRDALTTAAQNELISRIAYRLNFLIGLIDFQRAYAINNLQNIRNISDFFQVYCPGISYIAIREYAEDYKRGGLAGFLGVELNKDYAKLGASEEANHFFQKVSSRIMYFCEVQYIGQRQLARGLQNSDRDNRALVRRIQRGNFDKTPIAIFADLMFFLQVKPADLFDHSSR
jgi:hypothetical protein